MSVAVRARLWNRHYNFVLYREYGYLGHDLVVLERKWVLVASWEC